MAKEYNPNQSGGEGYNRGGNRAVYGSLTSVDGSLPPQALDLEEAVLGALMLEKDGIITIQDILKPEAFYSDIHKMVYKAIEELSMELKPVDLLTVTEKLKQKKQLKLVGGAQFLAQLTQRVASASHLEFHSTIIAQKFVQRELIRSSTEIQRRSYDESTDVTDLIDFAEQEIYKVAEGHISREVQSSKHIWLKTIAAIEEATKHGGTLNGVPTGFADIDRLTLGWQPSDLVIIAARPSMGKTALVLSMARNITVDYEKPVALFSLEMSSTQLMMRLLVSESQLSSTDVRSGRLTPEQWAHLEKSTKPLADAPLFIDDTPALSIAELRSKARRLKSQHDIQLIIIDYLQLMTGNHDTRGNREQEVSFISRSLKAIAKELNIPIIALSQLNRSVESRGGSKRPQLSDLRESGAIEQDADIVAFIHRPEYYGLNQTEDGQSTAGLAEIIVAKHRNGATDNIKLRFRSEQARFTDFDEVLTIGKSIDSDMSGNFSAVGSDNFAIDGEQSRGTIGTTYDKDSPF